MQPIDHVASILDTFGRDCSITVALKISDDSCKMDEEQRAIFMSLYDALPSYESDIFSPEIHTLIENARKMPSAMLFSQIKKEREMAMAIISQERMKAFKASIRAALLIAKMT